jgi:DNA-directed RNA polymerase specialized sigma24 family protein
MAYRRRQERLKGKMATTSLTSALSALLAAVGAENLSVPANAFSAEEMAEAQGAGFSTIRNRLARAVKLGTIKVKKGKRDGDARAINYYWV